jgi:hypothetical protein
MPSHFPKGLIFGKFFDLPAERQEGARIYLVQAWEAQFGHPPSTLSADLDALAELYRPDLPPKGLRLLADDLAPIAGARPLLPESLFIPVDDQRGLVTPEGRILLEFMSRFPGDPDTDETGADLAALVGRLLDFYSKPRRDWMTKTVTGGDLRPATLGFVVFLLINGSTGAARALRIPNSASDETRLAGPVIGVVNTFSKGIGGTPLRGRELTRLRSNWAITEASRQMPGIVRYEPKVGSVNARAYVVDGAEDRTIDALASALIKRKDFARSSLMNALGNTVNAYEDVRPLLKSWGLSWETMSHTHDVVAGVEESVMRRFNGVQP